MMCKTKKSIWLLPVLVSTMLLPLTAKSTETGNTAVAETGFTIVEGSSTTLTCSTPEDVRKKIPVPAKSNMGACTATLHRASGDTRDLTLTMMGDTMNVANGYYPAKNEEGKTVDMILNSADGLLRYSELASRPRWFYNTTREEGDLTVPFNMLNVEDITDPGRYTYTIQAQIWDY